MDKAANDFEDGQHRFTRSVPRRILRFFPDWGHEWPLWENGTEKYSMEPRDFGLSEGITARLRCWYDTWVEHFDIEYSDGTWTSDAVRLSWRDEGQRLVIDMQRELGGAIEVAPEFDDYARAEVRP